MKLRELLPVVETAYLYIETEDSPALMILKDYIPQSLLELGVLGIDSQGFLPRKDFEMAPDDQFVRVLKISLGEKAGQESEPKAEDAEDTVRAGEKAADGQSKTAGTNVAFDPQALFQASAQAADFIAKMIPQDPEVLNSILSQFNPSNLGDQAEFAEMFNSMIDNANLSNFSDFVDGLKDVDMSGLFHAGSHENPDDASAADDDDEDYIILDDDDE